MALDFPASPTDGQQYTSAGATWVWSATTSAWLGVAAGGGGGASITVGTTPPSSPTAGAMWWKSDEGRLKIYYDDGTSMQWVDSATGVVGPAGSAGAAGAAGSAGAAWSIAVNAQTGTSYTLQASDNGKVVTLSNASAITLTVPSGLGANFACEIIQLGAGQVTVAASGVTINSSGGLTKLAAQHAAGRLVAYVADVFNFAGDRA